MSGAGKRGLGGRVFAQDRGAAEAEFQLHLLYQHAAEEIGPGVVVSDAQPPGPHGGGKPGHLVVLLHGYGADGNDLIGLAPLLGQLMPGLDLFLSPEEI